MRKLIALTAACALAGGFGTAALAQGNATTEISTAHAHALMAQTATTVDMAHTHLHHVVNCLVGPSGQGFDASAGNPCKDQGNGAIPDSAKNPTVQVKLQAALADAQAGIKASSLADAQGEAGKVAATLQGSSGTNNGAASPPASR